VLKSLATVMSLTTVIIYIVLVSSYLCMCDTTSSFREVPSANKFWMCELITDSICYSNNPKFKVCSSNTLFSLFFSPPAVILEDLWLILFASCHTCHISRSLKKKPLRTAKPQRGSSKLSLWLYLAKGELSKHQLCSLSGCSTCQNERQNDR